MELMEFPDSRITIHVTNGANDLLKDNFSERLGNNIKQGRRAVDAKLLTD